MADLPDHLQSSLQHLSLIQGRIGALRRRRSEALDQLCLATSRTPLTLSERHEVWRQAKELNINGATTIVCKAMGTSPSKLRWEMNQAAIAAQTYFEGDFPIWDQLTPARGYPCVYGLIADSVLVYIGQSRCVRDRLKTHWRQRNERGGKLGIDAWVATVCEGHEALVDVEARLIGHYNPKFNKVGRTA